MDSALTVPSPPLSDQLGTSHRQIPGLDQGHLLSSLREASPAENLRRDSLASVKVMTAAPDFPVGTIRYVPFYGKVND